MNFSNKLYLAPLTTVSYCSYKDNLCKSNLIEKFIKITFLENIVMISQRESDASYNYRYYQKNFFFFFKLLIHIKFYSFLTFRLVILIFL